MTHIRGSLSDAVLACDPDIIHEILVEKADGFERDLTTRRAFAPLIGENSILLAEGANWRWQRRTVAPIFRHEALLSLIPTIAAMAERQVERWRATPPGAPIDAAAAMTHTTFDIIVDAMLGGSASLDAERYGRALAESFDTIPWHIIYAMFSLPRWLPYPGWRRAEAAREFLHSDTGRIVAGRRAQPAARPDLLELLLAARDPETGRGMSDSEVANNLLTFIVAGHETTAVALTWTLWLLAKDQAVQQRVFEEVTAVIGDAAPAAAHVEGLAFVRQVIAEAMRLFPPIPGMSRQPRSATALGGATIRKRTLVHIPIYALHRNSRLWDNPHAFDPDRFAPDRVKTRSRYAFLPFGGGQRACIGASLATIEAAIILATLVRVFRFAPLVGHRPQPIAKLTLRPADGMPLLITPR